MRPLRLLVVTNDPVFPSRVILVCEVAGASVRHVVARCPRVGGAFLAASSFDAVVMDSLSDPDALSRQAAEQRVSFVAWDGADKDALLAGLPKMTTV